MRIKFALGAIIALGLGAYLLQRYLAGEAYFPGLAPPAILLLGVLGGVWLWALLPVRSGTVIGRREVSPPTPYENVVRIYPVVVAGKTKQVPYQWELLVKNWTGREDWISVDPATYEEYDVGYPYPRR